MLLAQEREYFLPPSLSLFLCVLLFFFLLLCAALTNLELNWNCLNCYMSYLIVQIAFYSKD